jgi:hypothetical protein
MMRLDEPMTTLDADEWRASKRMKRSVDYQQRVATESPEAVRRRMLAWSEAIYRDDLTDPVERELVEEQAA